MGKIILMMLISADGFLAIIATSAGSVHVAGA
jgi:hypothetical protein